jgi:hypothetical protein
MAKLMLTGVPGTDTESEFNLSIDGIAIDHSLITRARLYLIDSTLALDSMVYPDAWSFINTDKVVVKLGRGDLVTGNYRGRLVTHDDNHLNGMHWDDELDIRML